jgi:hypothetical protein
MASYRANAREGLDVWYRVGLAGLSPHIYKPLGLLAGPLPHHENLFFLLFTCPMRPINDEVIDVQTLVVHYCTGVMSRDNTLLKLPYLLAHTSV